MISQTELAHLRALNSRDGIRRRQASKDYRKWLEENNCPILSDWALDNLPAGTILSAVRRDSQRRKGGYFSYAHSRITICASRVTPEYIIDNAGRRYRKDTLSFVYELCVELPPRLPTPG